MPDHVLIEAGWKGLLLDVGDEAVFVFAVREFFDEFVLGCHIPLDRVTRADPRCRLHIAGAEQEIPVITPATSRIAKKANIFLETRARNVHHRDRADIEFSETLDWGGREI